MQIETQPEKGRSFQIYSLSLARSLTHSFGSVVILFLSLNVGALSGSISIVQFHVVVLTPSNANAINFSSRQTISRIYFIGIFPGRNLFLASGDSHSRQSFMFCIVVAVVVVHFKNCTANNRVCICISNIPG